MEKRIKQFRSSVQENILKAFEGGTFPSESRS